MVLNLFQVVSSSGLSLPKSVSEIMDRWVLQMGFPVVTIDTVNGQLTQKHFLLDSDSVVQRSSIFKYARFNFNKILITNKKTITQVNPDV